MKLSGKSHENEALNKFKKNLTVYMCQKSNVPMLPSLSLKIFHQNAI